MTLVERVFAQESDLESIMALFSSTRTRMEEEGNDSWSHGYPEKEDFQEDISQGDSFLYKENGVVCAYIHVSFDPLTDFFFSSRSKTKLAQLRQDTGMKEGEEFLILHRLMIAPAEQGHGLAKEIFLDQARLYPGRMMMFAVFSSNFKAQRVYQRYGFQNAGIYSAFEYGEEGCYLYFKRFD